MSTNASFWPQISQRGFFTIKSSRDLLMLQLFSNRAGLLAGVLISMLVAFRVLYSGDGRYVFLLWNIFLGVIPAFASFKLAAAAGREKWKQILLLLIAIAFLPNSFYIITDLQHLQSEQAIPIWFDAGIIFFSAMIGLGAGYISIFNLEFYAAKFWSRSKRTAAALILFFLIAFGVYIGRYLRFNSWDIISDLVRLLSEISERFINPADHKRTWSMTAFFCVCFTVIWFAIRRAIGRSVNKKGSV